MTASPERPPDSWGPEDFLRAGAVIVVAGGLLALVLASVSSTASRGVVTVLATPAVLLLLIGAVGKAVGPGRGPRD